MAETEPSGDGRVASRVECAAAYQLLKHRGRYCSRRIEQACSIAKSSQGQALWNRPGHAWAVCSSEKGPESEPA
jgi:hypothetical protein